MQFAQLAPFTASDGENLALYEWQPDDDLGGELATCKTAPRGVVLIVHGLGEHAGRYEHVARRLMAWGFMVRSYDQRGHGESGGARGALPTDTALLDDLADVVDFSRAHCNTLVHALALKGVVLNPPPLILLGHSLGGLVAGCFVSLNMRPVDGLVMSSPALDAGLGALRTWALQLAHRFMPGLSVPNGLNPQFLSRSADVVKAYLADPLVHNRISARLGQFIRLAGPKTIAAAARWRTPTLLMYAGDDRLVNPLGSARFAAYGLHRAPPGTLTAQRFDGLFHEIFNAVDVGPVFATLQRWLDARFP